MKRIYISLTFRVDRPGERTEDVGEVVVVDWDSKSVVKTIIADSLKHVETGRSRGCGGITWLNDKLYVSCRQGISVFDPDGDSTELVRINPGEPYGLHQIKAHEGTLYVCSAGGDALTVIKNDELARTEKLTGGTFNPSSYTDTLHFNSLSWDSKGNQYHLYMKPRRIFNYTTGKDVARSLGGMPHDLCFLDDNRVLHTSSSSGKLGLVGVTSGNSQVVWDRPMQGRGAGAPSYRMLGFMRGVAYDKESGSVFVGTAPGNLHELEVDSWKLKSEFAFCTNTEASTYDILLDPRDWGLDV